MDRLILDTGVLVAAVRGRATVPDDADVAIPAIVIAEYLAGVHLDQDAGRQAADRAFLDEVLPVIPVHAYDRSVAEHHAALLAYAARQLQRRWAHELIVAATGRAILTSNRRARFGGLPDVNARAIT